MPGILVGFFKPDHFGIRERRLYQSGVMRSWSGGDFRPNFRWFSPPSEKIFYGDKGEKKGKKRNGKESQKDLAGERNPQSGKFA